MGNFGVVVGFVGGVICWCERERVLKLMVWLYVGWRQSINEILYAYFTESVGYIKAYECKTQPIISYAFSIYPVAKPRKHLSVFKQYS